MCTHTYTEEVVKKNVNDFKIIFFVSQKTVIDL